MTAPLTIELAGRRLPALRYSSVDDRHSEWDQVGWLWTSLVPIGESTRATIVTKLDDGSIRLSLGQREVMECWWDSGSVAAWEVEVRAEDCDTEDEALAQIVAWSRCTGEF